MAPLGGAHERAAHDDSFAARRDVRELLFDMSFVDGVITLEDALALRGATLHDRDVAAGRTGPQRRFLVPTGRGHNCILVRVVDCVRVQFDGQAPRSFWSSYCDRLVAILIDDVSWIASASKALASGPANTRGAPTETRKSLSAPRVVSGASTHVPSRLRANRGCGRRAPCRSRRRVACFTRKLAPLVVIALIVNTVPNRFINAASGCSSLTVISHLFEHA